MSKPVMSAEIGRDICDALGLPLGSVQSIDLRFSAGEIVTATVQFAPERDRLDEAMSILRRYELHEKPEASIDG